MATRLYFMYSQVAPVAVAAAASWNQSTYSTPDGARSTSKTKVVTSGDDGMVACETPTNPWYRRWAQFVSHQYAAFSWLTSHTIKLQILCKEDTANLDAFLHVNIRVVSGDGGTVRGTLYDGTGDTELIVNTYTNRNLGGGAKNVQNEVSMVAGDRLAIEIGFKKTSADSGWDTCYFRWGDTYGTDLPEDQTHTSGAEPWVEFSPNLDDYGGGVNRRIMNVV